jgi:hypothetical protein
VGGGEGEGEGDGLLFGRSPLLVAPFLFFFYVLCVCVGGRSSSPPGVEKGIGVQTLRRELLSENQKLYDALMRQEKLMHEMQAQVQHAQSNQANGQEELDKLKRDIEKQEMQRKQDTQQYAHTHVVKEQSGVLNRLQNNLHTAVPTNGGRGTTTANMGRVGRTILENSHSGNNGFHSVEDSMENSMVNQPGLGGRRYMSTYNNDNVDLSEFDLSKSKEFGVQLPSTARTPPPRLKMPVTPPPKDGGGRALSEERPLDDTLDYESRLIYPDGHSTEIGHSSKQKLPVTQNAPPHSPIAAKPAHNPMGPTKEQPRNNVSNGRPPSGHPPSGRRPTHLMAPQASGGGTLRTDDCGPEASFGNGGGTLRTDDFGEQTQELIAAMRRGDLDGTMGTSIGDTSLNSERSVDIDALYRLNLSKLKDLQVRSFYLPCVHHVSQMCVV